MLYKFHDLIIILMLIDDDIFPGDVEMRHAKIALRNDDPPPSLNKLRSRLIKDMSTLTTDNPSGSPLSTGAIIGIVIGSILGAVVLIGVVFLVRHFFCRFPGGSQNATDKFSVSCE